MKFIIRNTFRILFAPILLVLAAAAQTGEWAGECYWHVFAWIYG